MAQKHIFLSAIDLGADPGHVDAMQPPRHVYVAGRVLGANYIDAEPSKVDANCDGDDLSVHFLNEIANNIFMKKLKMAKLQKKDGPHDYDVFGLE
jgi:hypothetical protein